MSISMITGNEVIIPLPEPVFRPAWEMIKKHDSPAGKIEAFSRFIFKQHHREYIPDETDEMYEKIISSNFSTPLHEIISYFNVSERTVQRRFSERLGISPKMLSRIVKINYLWKIINTNNIIDYQDLLFPGNYFDQTHFIKDFKAVTGETPDHFIRRNLHIARVLSGRTY